MASHFSTIGLDIQDQGDLQRLIDQVWDDMESFEVPQGTYHRWRGSGGEEIWLQIDAENKLVGVSPHFTGKSSLRIGLQKRVQKPDDTPFEGAFYAWVNPSTDDPESGMYPFVFDVPDAAMHPDVALPGIATAQIAAFAHELTLYESLEAYEAEEKGNAVPFASQSFVPSGLFSTTGADRPQEQPYALFTGHIVEAEEKKSPVTGRIFHWALVDTLGGAFDVVFDPELASLPSERPRPGGVLSGTFWLSGRLLGYLPRKA